MKVFVGFLDHIIFTCITILIVPEVVLIFIYLLSMLEILYVLRQVLHGINQA